MRAPVGIAVIVGTYVVFVRLVERRPVVELARAHAAAELGRGLALGTLLFAGTMAVLCALGVAHVGHGDGWRALVMALLLALLAGFGEEILVRGVLFRIVQESLGTWIAIAFSAALFGALHGFNHGATIVSTLSIAFEAGVLLAAAYIFSRGLWLPIGLHIGWNFTEGGIFGASVSGGEAHGFLQRLHRPVAADRWRVRARGVAGRGRLVLRLRAGLLGARTPAGPFRRAVLAPVTLTVAPRNWRLCPGGGRGAQ